MFELTSHVGLFLAAFGAATVLPMQSEAVLVGMLLSDQDVVSTLLAVATFGNVLGSALNLFLGRSVERFRHKRWFPVSEGKLEKAQQSYLRYGRWSLLLSRVAIIHQQKQIRGYCSTSKARFSKISTSSEEAAPISIIADL
ncbi:hypothetical protein PVE_R1G6062 [Pseudomonas veronii 1YdBTEX2]|uniref:DedA family protein n=1 Tax=Pseudomonas veronii 1YdBTEX2 TaxID=1295141 RepID=A0A1D3K6W1_PSEVE|nr:YqaA family protein [Pseudomonas veronii]SBW83941.1 hypothetical protein PVE_R1G6062 [Pseudomonas veronii 1YdBTEX2]